MRNKLLYHGFWTILVVLLMLIWATMPKREKEYIPQEFTPHPPLTIDEQNREFDFDKTREAMLVDWKKEIK